MTNVKTEPSRLLQGCRDRWRNCGGRRGDDHRRRAQSCPTRYRCCDAGRVIENAPTSEITTARPRSDGGPTRSRKVCGCRDGPGPPCTCCFRNARVQHRSCTLLKLGRDRWSRRVRGSTSVRRGARAARLRRRPLAEQVRRTVCTHCSVGCAVDAVVKNGVWVRQEPVFDSPLNMGAHCAKGASVREHGMTEHSHRLKYPMKLVDGKYQRISWDQVIDEITAKMSKIREDWSLRCLLHRLVQAQQRAGPTWRKFVSLWGTNNCDHQARICHSTTVAGVANTWGYGRDDELVQRHAEYEGDVVHRVECG